MDTVQDYQALIAKHGSYLRLPERLVSHSEDASRDDFIMEARLSLIRTFLQARQPVDTVVDMGACNGYFSLSLLDDQLARQAVLFEIDEELAAYAQSIGVTLGKSDNIKVLTDEVSLDTLESLPDGDLILCQNLIHHAGATYDVEQVKKLGWEGYSRQFLEKLRKKYRYGVIAVGFKDSKPVQWNVSKVNRANVFREYLADAGWHVVMDKNFFELSGGQKALPSPITRLAMSTAWRFAGERGKRYMRKILRHRPPAKGANYHIFLVE